MNGAQMTLLGGIISVVGVVLSLWGAYKSSKSDEVWQGTIGEKTTLILESNTNRSKADQKLIQLREDNLKRELQRNLSEVNVDQILENANNIRSASSDLERAQQEEFINNRAELIKIAKPIFTFVQDYAVAFTEEIEKKGLVKKKAYHFIEEESQIGIPSQAGTFFSVTTVEDKLFYVNWHNKPLLGSNSMVIQIAMGGKSHIEPIEIDVENGCTITFLDKTKFNISPSQMNNTDKLKSLADAIVRVLNESFTFQLSS